MPKTITREVYAFDELSDEAKERVKQWLREDDNDWYDSTFEDFIIVAAAFGFNIRTTSHTACRIRPPHEQFTTTVPDIFFKSDYGWTAGFNARWSLLDATKAETAIKEHLDDELLNRMAKVMCVEIAKFTMVGLEPIVRAGGAYLDVLGSDSGIADCDGLCWDTEALDPGPDGEQLTPEQIAACQELNVTVEATAKDLARWLAKQLEAEDEYRWSDEAVKETCDGNAYYFNERGGIER